MDEIRIEDDERCIIFKKVEVCEFCKKEAECNFGMHGDGIRMFFCSVDCMVNFAKGMKAKCSVSDASVDI